MVIYGNELKNKFQNEIKENVENINDKIENISLKLLDDEDEIYYHWIKIMRKFKQRLIMSF